MGYDLRRGEDGISLSIDTWPRAYALAIEGGWEPLGTLPHKSYANDSEPWSGAYYGTEGQTLVAEDARAMADALADMVAMLPEESGEGSFRQDPMALSSSRVDPATYFTDAGKRRVLQALINFLRDGECQIW